MIKDPLHGLRREMNGPSTYVEGQYSVNLLIVNASAPYRRNTVGTFFNGQGGYFVVSNKVPRALTGYEADASIGPCDSLIHFVH
jgi:hypothetical protein